MNTLETILQGVVESPDAQAAVVALAKNIAAHLQSVAGNQRGVEDFAGMLHRESDHIGAQVMANVPTIIAHRDGQIVGSAGPSGPSAEMVHAVVKDAMEQIVVPAMERLAAQHASAGGAAGYASAAALLGGSGGGGGGEQNGGNGAGGDGGGQGGDSGGAAGGQS